MDDTINTNISLSAGECVVFLGRELTPNEENNFALFLAVATARLNALLGVDITAQKNENNIPLIQLLLARLVGVISDEQEAAQNRGVVAKAVEDFKVEYDETASTPMHQFVEYNADLLKLFAPKPMFRAGSNAYDGKSLCI